MRICIQLIAAGILAAAGSPAFCQTLSLAVDDQGTYTRSYHATVGEEFDVVTLANTDGNDVLAGEWVQTDLLGAVPGVFKLQTTRLCNTCDYFGGYPGGPGEYRESFGACRPASEALEILRIKYLPIDGFEADDFVLSIRGLEPGDTWPSSFDGEPGFVDCANAKLPATVERGDAWQTGSGVVVPSGALVLDPTPPLVVGSSELPLSHLKVRYRR